MLENLAAADENTILCGFCASPVAQRTKGPPSEAGCAFCNNWADIHEVIAIAIESVVSAARSSHGDFYKNYLFTTDYEVR